MIEKVEQIRNWITAALETAVENQKSVSLYSVDIDWDNPCCSIEGMDTVLLGNAGVFQAKVTLFGKDHLYVNTGLQWLDTAIESVQQLADSLRYVACRMSPEEVNERKPHSGMYHTGFNVTRAESSHGEFTLDELTQRFKQLVSDAGLTGLSIYDFIRAEAEKLAAVVEEVIGPNHTKVPVTHAWWLDTKPVYTAYAVNFVAPHDAGEAHKTMYFTLEELMGVQGFSLEAKAIAAVYPWHNYAAESFDQSVLDRAAQGAFLPIQWSHDVFADDAVLSGEDGLLKYRILYNNDVTAPVYKVSRRTTDCSYESSRASYYTLSDAVESCYAAQRSYVAHLGALSRFVNDHATESWLNHSFENKPVRAKPTAETWRAIATEWERKGYNVLRWSYPGADDTYICVAHSGSAQAEISKEGDTYTAKLCYPSKAIERASFVTMRSAMLYVQESFACEIPE